MSLNYSTSEENYLKAIYHLQEEDGTVTTNVLADRLNTKPASVTDMMKKLNGKKLLHYKPYYGFSLSADGRKIALSVIRRHRLWEYFLAEKLKFSWDEVHSVAEDLEHVSSKKLIDKLDEYLGFPEFDPHGDPIPDNKGKMKSHSRIPLSGLPENQPGELCQVTNQSQDLLDYLREKNITIGTRMEVRKRNSFDHSLEVKIRNQSVTLTEQLAKNLFVKKV
ncbi:MAG TPA: metal-dependent transcriptional regulator [Flavisolibacter sp.]|jgi:DtxR family Mn-dependent transcriptional regulator